MRRAKVTGYKPPSRGFGLRVGLLGVLGFCHTILRGALPLFPFILIGVLFLLPKTPHIRVSYTYTGSYENPRTITCRYLGIHGWFTLYGNHCPILTMLNGKT